MATAEKSTRHQPTEQSRYAETGSSLEEFDDSDIENDEDGVPIPRESGPVPRPRHTQSFAHAARSSRDGGVSLPDAGLPREGGLIASKYRVNGVHHRDAMVVTLKASHVELGQRVWIRYLLPRAARGPDTVARFMRSARSVARMRSEHAARVLDVGRIRSGIPFVVIDDMNGWDLGEVLRVRGPLPVQEAVEYILQAADAVAEAHALGIVHGSINLSNLLLARRDDESPFIKVVGFELSEVVEGTVPSDALDSAPGSFVNTLPYLSPEQIRSEETVDQRADVWAMGAVLHALLTGGPPFRARTAAALLAAVSADEPRQVGEARADVAPDLEEIIQRCLAKNPGDRPGTIAELVSGLTAFASGDGLSVIDRISRMPSPSRRPPPLPVPPTRAIVPVARPKKAEPEKVSLTPPPAQWLILTAAVGLGASILGATAVILASNAGAPRAARDEAPAPTAVLQQLPAPGPAAPQLLAPAAPVPSPAGQQEAPLRVPAATVARAPAAPRTPSTEAPRPRAETRVAHTIIHDGAENAAANPPKDLFDDTR